MSTTTCVSPSEFRTMIITCRLCIASCIACILVMLVSFYLMFATPEGMAMMGMSHESMQKAATDTRSAKDGMTPQMREHCAMMPDMAGCEKFHTQQVDHTMGSMSMDAMAQMLRGKNGKALDCAFLEGMIPHHQWALDMSGFLKASTRPELQQFGANITAGQQKEIDQMRQWQIDWGCTQG